MAGGAVAESPSSPSWVGEALDEIGSWSLRAKAPFVIGLLMLFDSWDSVVIAYTLPVLVGQWGLSALQAGSLISAGYGGQFVGAIVFGSLAERYGRLPLLKLLVLVMSLLAIACALASSYEQLITLRLLQGLAIGGALPVAIGYINEIAPTATRRRLLRHVPVPDGQWLRAGRSGQRLADPGLWLANHVRARRGAAPAAALHADAARIAALARGKRSR